MTDTRLRLTPYILGKTSQIGRSQFKLRAHLFFITLNVLGLGRLLVGL